MPSRLLESKAGNGRRRLWFLAALLALSFAGKVVLRLVVLPDPNYWQSGYTVYFQMADNYLHTGSMFVGRVATESGRYYAFRPPLYPLLIAAICRLTDSSPAAFVICEAIISSLTVALVYGITARLAKPPAALLSATLYAFYPYSFYHDTQLQENVLYNAVSLCAVAIFLRAVEKSCGREFLLSGATSGAAVLTRVSHVAAAIFLLGVTLVVYRSQWRKAGRFALLYMLGLLIILGPWLIRNERLRNHFALTSETGFALARAHNEYTFRHYPYRASIDAAWRDYHANLSDDKQFALSRVASDEFARSQWYSREALDYIRAHPFDTLWHGFYKAAVNFLGILSPLKGTFANWIYFVSYWCLTLLALRGLARLRGEIFVKVLLVMVLAQLSVSFVFWAHTSHRSFLDPLFAIPAGIGLATCALRTPR